MSTTTLDPTETETVVPTAVGDLGAIIRRPAPVVEERAEGTRLETTSTPAATYPGVLLVDGSGDGDRYDWGGWPEWLADAGSVTLRHDKPGCGGSPGHWTDQTIEHRALETLAAVRVLRDHPATAGQPIGLYGISQGGWVALLAAALEPETVDFVMIHSGPGTTPAAQERERIEAWVRTEGHDEAAVAEAMAWVERREGLLRGTRSADDILAEQSTYSTRPWFDTVAVPYDSVAMLGFVRGILDFDPTTVMPNVGCPVLALFGGADTVIPVQASLRAFAEHLPEDPRHGFAVFPGADHGLFVAAREEGVPRITQLAPAYLATVRGFLADRRRS